MCFYFHFSVSLSRVHDFHLFHSVSDEKQSVMTPWVCYQVVNTGNKISFKAKLCRFLKHQVCFFLFPAIQFIGVKNICDWGSVVRWEGVWKPPYIVRYFSVIALYNLAWFCPPFL